MIIKSVLLAIGCISLALGIIGIFLPVLPTTPFLLLTATCFAKSSQQFHRWLMTHPWFGPYIRMYTDGLGIPLTVKYRAIGVLWLTMGISIVFFAPWLWLKVSMWLIALTVSIYLWTRPTAPPVSLPDASGGE